MELRNLNCTEFCSALDSKEPVPGGGGASALAGALGAALAGMVCSLTVGKKKYAAVEDEVKDIWQKASSIKSRLLEAIDKDAECFEPLARAYGMAKDDPGRDTVMENALRTACTAPFEIMKLSAETLELLLELKDKGSVLALSDVGVGASMARAAITGASLNIYINTKLMKDREYAEELNREADGLLERYTSMSDEIYAGVLEKLR